METDGPAGHHASVTSDINPTGNGDYQWDCQPPAVIDPVAYPYSGFDIGPLNWEAFDEDTSQLASLTWG